MKIKLNYFFQNKKLKSLALFFSCVSFFILKSPSSISGIIGSIPLCLLLYFLIVNMLKARTNKTLYRVLTYLLSILLLLNEPNNFFNKWIYSNKADMISKLLNIELSDLLYFLGYFLAILSIYFVYYLIVTIIKIIKDYANAINLKSTFNSLLDIFMNNKINEYLIDFIKVLLVVIVASTIGFFILVFVFENKAEIVNINVKESANLIKEEGVYPKLYSFSTSQLDNYTDAIMLLESGNKYDDSSKNKAMLVYRDTIPDKNPYDVLIDKYVENEKTTNNATYPRYWHGYLSILIPLLSIMNYVEIRIANGICQSILAITLVIILCKKNMKHLVLPYIISVSMLCLPALANSLQFSSCYYIMTIGSLLILLNDKNKIKTKYIFLLIGIFVAYFDFLTYPIATFGFPMIIYYSCNSKSALENKLYNFIINALYWALGYGLMWFSKWLIATLITNENVINNALTALSGRTSNISPSGYYYSIVEVLGKNIGSFVNTPFVLAFIIFVSLHIYRIYKLTINNELSRKEVDKKSDIIIPYILILILPISWYGFAINHSAIHYWFTNKALVISVFAIMTCLVNLEKEFSNEQK